MPTKENKQTKDEVLDQIFLKEEDTIGELIELINLSKNFFMVEQETGNAVFKNVNKLTVKDKIVLLLIARYFAKNKGVVENDALSITEIAKILDIPKTTLSKPIGGLFKSRIVKKSEGSKYSMIYHQIKYYLENLVKNKKV